MQELVFPGPDDKGLSKRVKLPYHVTFTHDENRRRPEVTADDGGESEILIQASSSVRPAHDMTSKLKFEDGEEQGRGGTAILERRTIASAYSQTSEKEKLAMRGVDGKYLEIPGLLDGFFMLNRGPAEDPSEIYSLNISGSNLNQIMEEDLSLFQNLTVLIAGENKLAPERLSGFSNLRRLVLPYNDIKTFDIDIGLRFPKLEDLDLSYNRLSPAEVISLSILPGLKKLDLTSNGINEFPKDIIELDSWREKARAIWLEMDQEQRRPRPTSDHDLTSSTDPKDTKTNPASESVPPRPSLSASSMVRNGGSEAQKDRPETATMPAIFTDDFTSGFRKLESLCMERNKLSSPEALAILGKLPFLKSLNLSHNKFTSLASLSPRKVLIQTPATGETPDTSRPQTTSQCDGFPSLQELHISHNLIDTPEGLMGLVWIKTLQRVWIEGNPVMAKKGQKVLITRNGQGKLIEFNPSTLFPMYNISVMDGFAIKGRRKPSRSLAPPLPRATTFKPVKYTTKDDTYSKSFMSSRIQLNDEDINEIIKEGKILGLHELKRRQQRKKHREFLELDDALDQAHRRIELERIKKQEEESHQIRYDASKTDGTFMTGVHIEERLSIPNGGRGRALSRMANTDCDDCSVDSGEDEYEFAANEIQLPKSIQTSLRSLRQALANPTLFWKVVENNYTKETFASKMRKSNPTRLPLDYWLPSPGTQHGSTFSKQIEEHIRSCEASPNMAKPSRRLSSIKTQNDASYPDLESGTKRVVSIVGSGLNLNLDEDMNKDLKDMMSIVDLKLRMVEMNLSTVLSNKAFRKTLPASVKLLENIQSEYDRLEDMFLKRKDQIEDGYATNGLIDTEAHGEKE